VLPDQLEQLGLVGHEIAALLKQGRGQSEPRPSVSAAVAEKPPKLPLLSLFHGTTCIKIAALLLEAIPSP
jgi:hypothetical protein